MEINDNLINDIKQMIEFTINDIYDSAYTGDIKQGWIDILKELKNGA